MVTFGLKLQFFALPPDLYDPADLYQDEFPKFLFLMAVHA